MLTQARHSRVFRRVEPMQDFRLCVDTMPGEHIVYDFTPRLCTTRFADLKNRELFKSVTTDGESLIFALPGVMPVSISAGEFFALLAKDADQSELVKGGDAK